jgi:hypothetical protein
MKTFFELRDEYIQEQYLPLYEEIQRYLEEKLLILGKGGNYGNAVILAGGAGSGKSFAAMNLMQGDKFKIFNPDDIKDALLKMRDTINAEKMGLPKAQTIKDVIPLIQGLNLQDPNDTGKLHMVVKNLGLDQKQLITFFADKTRSQLPNVMFDMTLKDMSALVGEMGGEQGVLQFLKQGGYKPENIHIVWILTDYQIALQQNLTRKRVVATDILFKTHRGAAGTMQDIMFRTYGSLGINGDIAVIMGGKANTIEIKKGGEYTYPSGPNRGKTIKLHHDLKGPAIMDFKYFRVKKAGSREVSRDALVAITDYIKKYAPTPDITPEKAQSQALAAIAANPDAPQVSPTTLKALGVRG